MKFNTLLQLGLYDEYRPIEGYSKYMVSAMGHIYSYYSHRNLSETRENGTGYRQLLLKPDFGPNTAPQKGDEKLVHKLVAEAFNLDPFGLFDETDHINNNKKDARLCNLQPLTKSENCIKREYNIKCQNEGYKIREVAGQVYYELPTGEA